MGCGRFISGPQCPLSVSEDKKGDSLGGKDILGSVPHSANTCQAPIVTRGGGGAAVGMSQPRAVVLQERAAGHSPGAGVYGSVAPCPLPGGLATSHPLPRKGAEPSPGAGWA